MTLEYTVSDDEDSPKEQLINTLHASANASSTRSLPKFPEIRGLCRTCDSAHITRRQYDEMPTIRCGQIRSARSLMPHDVMECTEYSRRGQFSLRDMAEMAIIIDARKKAGGQYL